jgi:hypothetical protein
MESQSNPALVNRLLSLLTLFLDKYEGKDEKPVVRHHYYQHFNFNIDIYNERRERHTMKVHTTNTIGQFRTEVAKIYGIDQKLCELRVNGDKVIDPENDDLSIRIYANCFYILVK